MIMERIVQDDGTVTFVSPDGRYRLTQTHPENPDCKTYGCVIHAPTEIAIENVEGWPYNIREDRTPLLIERICPHGIGHPDPDQASFNIRAGREAENIHGCCGCEL